VVLGSNGRVYSTAVNLLPGGRGDGQPITTLIDLETATQPAHYVAGSATQTLLLASSGGFGLLARVGNLLCRNKGGKSYLTLEAGETLLAPCPTDTQTQVACLSASGRLLIFALSELKLQPNGGRGLTLMDIDAPDTLISLAAFNMALQVLGTGRGGKAKEETVKAAALLPYVGKRARKGKLLEAGMKATVLKAG
jgi:topoisomerase IV subunit A